MDSIIKRSRQFFRAVFSRMDSEDRVFIEQYLNPAAKILFYNMDNPVQKHCVNVARTVQNICRGQDLDTTKLITAALLHDIGKIRGSFSLVHRVLYVLSRRISPRLTEKLSHVIHAFHVHLNHERLGAELAKKSNLPQGIIFLIENHHNLALAAESKELAILFKADEMN